MCEDQRSREYFRSYNTWTHHSKALFAIKYNPFHLEVNRCKDIPLCPLLDLTFPPSKTNRVWKGIFGIRDLTKIRCGNRENDKYLDGIRDLTARREAGLTKIWARDAGFFRLFVGNLGNRHGSNKNVLAAKAIMSPFKPNYRVYLVIVI